MGKEMLRKIPARKIGMTSAFDSAGTTVPVTLVQPMMLVITEIKRPATHGYSAVQVAYGETTAKHVNKPLRGILTKAGVERPLRAFYECRLPEEELAEFQIGQELDPVDVLKTWDLVKVVGTSKGKGFAGSVKRHHFAGQCRTHGDPDNRRSMSNGATDAARVFKGSRRAGRMGNERVSLRGVTVFEYDPSLNLLALTGGVPGPPGGLVYISLITERAPEETMEEA
jgi:large subunit ribosomal protein L3